MQSNLLTYRIQAHRTERFEFFRSELIPPKVLNLVADKAISQKELALLTIAHTYIDCDEGCRATNRTIAAWLGINTRKYVTVMIGKLADLGLLRVTYVHCVRHIQPIGWESVPRNVNTTKRLYRGSPVAVGPEEDSSKTENTVPRFPRDIVLKSSNDYSGTDPLPSSNDGGDGIPSPPEPAMLIEPIAASTPKSTATEFDTATATRLRTEVCKAQARTIPFSRTKWADEIRKLRESLRDEGESRISKAMDWYIRNIGKEYTPVAFSAESFRRKFDQIEAAARRAEARTPTAEITEEAKSMASWLKLNKWPSGSGASLETVIQLSLNNLRDFLKRLKNHIPSKTTSAFRKHLLERWACPDKIITRWMKNVWDRLHRWKDWNGTLVQWVWKFDRDEITAEGRRTAAQYGSRAADWDDLIKEIGGANANRTT